MVRDTRLEDIRLLNILRYVLDEDFRSTTGKKILLVGVELDGVYRHSIVDGSGRNTASAKFELLITSVIPLNDFPCIPKSNSAIAHS